MTVTTGTFKSLFKGKCITINPECSSEEMCFLRPKDPYIYMIILICLYISSVGWYFFRLKIKNKYIIHREISPLPLFKRLLWHNGLIWERNLYRDTPAVTGRTSGFYVSSERPPRFSRRVWKHRVVFTFSNWAAVTWLKYCRYGVKLYPINLSINQTIN